jgi:MFS family permease
LYGVYAAATEGVSKAWISKIAPQSETATAIGFYASCASFAALFSSSFAGFLWVSFSPSATFSFATIGVIFVSIYFLFLRKKNLRIT